MIADGVSVRDVSLNLTAPITLTLPPGVSFTSVSGEFLTNETASTPEPSYVGLLVAGALVVEVFSHRRKLISARVSMFGVIAL